jgi:hypothetical protein
MIRSKIPHPSLPCILGHNIGSAEESTNWVEFDNSLRSVLRLILPLVVHFRFLCVPKERLVGIVGEGATLADNCCSRPTV